MTNTEIRINRSVEGESTSPGLGPFLQLLAVLHRTKGSAPECGLFAFTSATRGEGVTYVTNALANELAQHTSEHVLLAPAGTLASLTAPEVETDEGVFVRLSGHLWTLDPDYPDRMPASEIPPGLMAALRKRFTYVLVDCRALEISPEVLHISAQMDGVVLVVAAGQSSREQVQHAQRLLKLASDKMLGCVLNKQKLRKYKDSYYGRTHDIAS